MHKVVTALKNHSLLTYTGKGSPTSPEKTASTPYPQRRAKGTIGGSYGARELLPQPLSLPRIPQAECSAGPT
jgi:hypothetical protein